MKPRLEKWLARLCELGRVYEVGGLVRDDLLGTGLQSKDRDYLVTGIPFDDLVAELKKHGRVGFAGKSFGVLKFTPPYGPHDEPATYDIALPRKEQSTGIRHTDFAVDFDHTRPVEDDLVRRDFTINAMARDVQTGEIIDPTGGRRDLQDRVIRFVGEHAFLEDPLRMLRAVQFVARFEFSLDPATKAAIVEHAELLRTISAERISEELNKLMLKARTPSIGWRLMQETGLLGHFLPELAACVGVDQPGGYHAFTVFEHSIRTVDEVPISLRLKWAALLHDINKPQTRHVEGEKASFYGHEKQGSRTAKQILRRLRYSNELIDDVSLLIDRHMFTTEVSDKGMRRLIRRMGPELVFDLLDLRRADVVAQGMRGKTEDVDELEQRIRAELERKPPFGLSDLAVDGRDIMNTFGLQPGPQIGKTLNFLLEQVLDDPTLNMREKLLELARDFISRNLT
jgi:tRNA nucleotidyltransferase (CCA-adding enzyme)